MSGFYSLHLIGFQTKEMSLLLICLLFKETNQNFLIVDIDWTSDIETKCFNAGSRNRIYKNSDATLFSPCSE